jgi:colicin import membrane protein
MKRRAHEQEAKASQLSTEVARLEDKADESKRQEEAYRRELERVRGVAWQEAERLRKEKEASQESIAVKLRDEVERHRRTSEEAEELLAERDELLTTLRKEASDATNSYEQELDRVSAQVDDAYAKQQAAEDRASAAQRARREAEEHADALEIARAKAEREAAAAKSRQSHILVPAATSAAS